MDPLLEAADYGATGPTRTPARLDLDQIGRSLSSSTRCANALGDQRFSLLSQQQRLALQSWAHQQGSPRFNAYINGEGDFAAGGQAGLTGEEGRRCSTRS